MDFEKSIPFDLGLGQHVQSFAANIEYAYSELNSFVNSKMRKFQFQRFYPIFDEEIELNINFYIGCMLWACYIKQFDNKEISENPVLGEDVNEEQSLFNVNYLRNYLPKFEKDSKYYLNKIVKINPKYYDLIDLYEEFLKINNHFVNTKTSSDLNLPFKIENPDYNKILNTIQKAVETGDFSSLREYMDILLENKI